MVNTNKEKKMTKRDYYNVLLGMGDVKANKAVVDFINHELELLAKKNSGDRTPTASQVANDKLAVDIINEMEVNRLYTITEMTKVLPCCAGLTGQKVSAIIRKLKDAGQIERLEEKGKAFFRLVK